VVVTATAAVVLAAGLDAVAAEPPARVHPVALFGRSVAPFDRSWNRPRAVGVAATAVLPAAFAGVAAGAVAAGLALSPAAGAVAAGLALFSTTSLRMLLDATDEVVAAAGDDVDAARRSLRALAGRDASDLGADHLRSAAVESAAENLADGLVAPLGAFAVCAPVSLPLAVGAAAWVKGVNTLDSMLGYRSKPVGWAPARLDDAVMWVPARLSAALVALAAGRPGLLRSKRLVSLARRPDSPNSGWPMAAMAAVLPARLEKRGHYDLDPAGDGPSALPSDADAARAVTLTRRAGWLAFALAGAVAWF
jgi:adenosylcobinamide-phosphate synthase